MTTMGTTTATAIFPPCDKPPELAELAELSALLVANGAALEEEDRLEGEATVNEGVG